MSADDFRVIRSEEARMLKSALQSLQGEVDRNRADIVNIRKEFIEELQTLEGRIMGGIGKLASQMERSISQKFDGLLPQLEHRIDKLIDKKLQMMSIPPVREELPSRPEIVDLVKEEAKRVVKEEKYDSMRARANDEKDYKRDVRNARLALYVAIAAGVAGTIIGHFVK